MERIVFVNACVRPGSRTKVLAQEVLKKLDGCVEEVKLYDTPMAALDLEGMEKRNRAARDRDFSDPSFDLARQFAAADAIVIAAPYWDLMFPAVVKTYFENVTVSGISCCYSPQETTKISDFVLLLVHTICTALQDGLVIFFPIPVFLHLALQVEFLQMYLTPWEAWQAAES